MRLIKLKSKEGDDEKTKTEESKPDISEEKKGKIAKKINVLRIIIICSVVMAIVFIILFFVSLTSQHDIYVCSKCGYEFSDPAARKAWAYPCPKCEELVTPKKVTLNKLSPFVPLDFLIMTLLVLLGPYGFYKAAQHSRIKDIEKRLPEFLRDVAEAGRFGMILADAIIVASSGKYGRLTPEIQKMAAQIRWGVPVTDALYSFGERVNTPLVKKTVAIIIKSHEAGGNVADVLGLVSRSTKEDLLTKEERKIAMSTYVAVVYIAFFVFLVTIIIMNATFLPKMEEAGRKIAAASEAGLSGGITIQASYIPDVNFALVISAVIHAVGDGILAGVLETGKIPYGMRHAFVLLLFGYPILRMI